MLFKKVLKEKRDNRGMSLVEVVCAVAIFGLTATLVSTAMKTSMQSYNRGIQETDLQKEGQVFANQIADLVIDSTADVTFDASTSTLTIVQKVGGTEVKHQITLDADGKVWYVDVNGTEAPQLLAEGVQSIDFDLSNFNRTGNLGVSLVLKSTDNNRTLDANYTVTSRNGRDGDDTVSVVATIKVDPFIVIEPMQHLTIQAEAQGVSDIHDLRYTIVSGAAPNTTINSLTGEVVCDPNQKDDVVVRIYTNETLGGVPKAEAFVTLNTRRVNKLDLTATQQNGIQMNKAGAKFLLDASLIGSYLDKWEDSVYDNDYVNPYQVAWSTNMAADAYELVVDPTDTRLATLTLKRDLVSGENLIVKAENAHAVIGASYNKSGWPYDPAVYDTFKISGPIPWGYPHDWPDGILRGDQREQIPLNMDFLLQKKNEFGGSANWKFWFKYQKIGAGEPVSGWILNSEGSGADGNDSAAYKLRPDYLFCMDRDYGYHFWMIIVMYDNDGNQLWPPTDEPLDPYSYEGDMAKFGIRFSSSLLGFEDITANNDNVPKLTSNDGNEVELFRYTSCRGWYDHDSAAKEFARQLDYKLQKQNADGTWSDCNQGGMRHNGGAEAACLIRPGQLSSGHYRVLMSFKKIQHYTMVDNLPIEGWDYDVKLYDDTYTEGVIYFDKN